MPMLYVVDMDKKDINEIEIPKDLGINTVYRNEKTKALDSRYGELLSHNEQFTPIMLGSCYTEGNYVLPPLAEGANITGFYFGVEKEHLPSQMRAFIRSCVRERDIEIVEFEGKEIVVPINFK